MTVSTSSNRISYNGDGATTVFSFPYKFLAAADLVVYVGGVLQVLTTAYSVGTPSDSGANVTFMSAPVAGSGNVVILRDPSALQSTALPSNDPFPSKAVETMADKLTMLVQRLKDLITRSTRFPDSYSGSADPTLPTPIAGAYLRWNTIGTALEAVAVTFTTALTFIQSGVGAIVRTWQAKVAEQISVTDFGAVGDFNPVTGTGTDNLAAIQAWLNYLALTGNCKGVVPAGKYKIGAGYFDALTQSHLVLGSLTTPNAANNITLDFEGTFYQSAPGRALVIANANNVRGNPKIIGYVGGALSNGPGVPPYREQDYLVYIGYASTNITLDNDFYLANGLGLNLSIGSTLLNTNDQPPKNVTIGKGVVRQRYGNGTASWAANGTATQHAIFVVDVEGLTITPECVVYGTVDLEPNNINQVVTLSNASPCVASFGAGLLASIDGGIINFTTTGGLPTGLVVGTDYYVRNSNAAAGTCNLSATRTGALINTSSAGSGVHTAFFHQRLIDCLIRPTFRSAFVTPILGTNVGITPNTPFIVSEYWAEEPLGLSGQGGTEIQQGVAVQGIDTDPYIHGITIGPCSMEAGSVYVQGQAGAVRPGAYRATVQDISFYKGKIQIGTNSGNNNNPNIIVKGCTAQQVLGGANSFIEINGALNNCQISDNTLVTGDLPCVARVPVSALTLDSGNNKILNNNSLGSVSQDGVVLTGNGWPVSTTIIAGNLPNSAAIKTFGNTVASVTSSAALAPGQTRTVTVAMPQAGPAVVKVRVGGTVAGNLAGSYAEFLAGGDFSSTTIYGVTELARVNVTASMTISTFTKNNGNFTFTVANASGVQAGNLVVSAESTGNPNNTPTITIV